MRTINLANHIWSVADLLARRLQAKPVRARHPALYTLKTPRVRAKTSPANEVLAGRKRRPRTTRTFTRNLKLLRAARHPFYNTSAITLAKLGENDTLDNLITYVQSF